ncbi:unnamed protein product [Lactuca virosa]|uniref:Uncharacterized protein n=1 Tax=Lactuca virosa TaxID=75947 RepID=A0AAU9PIU8_9ASTR|nr:unnamed protein product [Lactuca virosa]
MEAVTASYRKKQAEGCRGCCSRWQTELFFLPRSPVATFQSRSPPLCRHYCCHRGLMSLPPRTATVADGTAAAVTVHHRGWLHSDSEQDSSGCFAAGQGA